MPDTFEYPVTLIQENDGRYFAQIRDLPGCMTVGDTIPGALKQLEENKNDWIEDAKKEGRPIPEPSHKKEYSGKFLLRIPRALHRQLSEKSEEEGVSLNHLVSSILSKG